MSFVERAIDVTITYPPTGMVTNQTVLTGHRVQTQITIFGGATSASAMVRIYGLPLATINALTVTGAVNPTAIGQNGMTLSAGDLGGKLAVIFKGGILYAWGDFQNAPDVSLNIFSTATALDALKPAVPNSFAGAVPVANLMQKFAQAMGYAFQNNGVTGVLRNPYFAGTLLNQAQKCAQQAGIQLDISNGVFAILPKGASRQVTAPVLSPGGGLGGYPAFTQNRLDVTSIFLPEMRIGYPFIVRGSQIVAANREWAAYHVSHDLESQTPRGSWFTHLTGFTHV